MTNICQYCTHARKDHYPIYPGFCKLDKCRCPRFLSYQTVHIPTIEELKKQAVSRVNKHKDVRKGDSHN